MSELPALLLAADVARVLKITEGGARNLMRSGKVPARKVGRKYVVVRDLWLASLSPSKPDRDERDNVLLRVLPPPRRRRRL